MVFKRFFEPGLAQASFLIGCPGTGEAIIVDPNRDFGMYMAAAAEEGLRVAAVTETHIHADYLSGVRELALRTGAMLYLSDEGDADWKYAFARDPNVRLLHSGDTIRAGAVQLRAVHTPGHTPEHLTLLLSDLAVSEEPLGAFTGDFVFAGDVGRPDLLESAAGVAGSSEPAARRLHRSLQEFKRLPDHLLIWPAHGAGSACGKALGGSPVSSLGYERRHNWAFQIEDEDAFVREVLSGQPDPPPYFARMKRLNKSGPPMRTKAPRLERGPIHEAGGDAFWLDIRSMEAFQESHVTGCLNIPLGRPFAKYAGWFVPYERPVHLISASQEDAEEAARSLSFIGIDNVPLWESADEALKRLPTQSLSHCSVNDLPPGALMLDVRSGEEWDEGHWPGSVHIPYGQLPNRFEELPGSRPIVVYCQSNPRSAVAASFLQKVGFRDVCHLWGGYAALQRTQEELAAGSPG